MLGFVGKAVTFDSGGISLKPGAKMAEMKFDMSGGAAVVEAVAAIARLQLPVKLLAVVGATENLPDGRAVKPGRHRHGEEREDDRDQQHRRRGPARARRLPLPRGLAGGRADRRPGDAHRRGDRRARLDLRGDHVQRRRAHRAAHRRGRAHRRDPLAAAAAPRVRRARRGHVRRPRQRAPKRARRARSWAPRSSRTSSPRRPGRTSTSPARPGISAARTSARARSGYGVRLLVELARSYSA